MAHIVQIHIEQAGLTRDLLSVSLMFISGDLRSPKVSLRSGNLKEPVLSLGYIGALNAMIDSKPTSMPSQGGITLAWPDWKQTDISVKGVWHSS